MEFAEAHSIILWAGFGIALVMGMVVNKTDFCTMGAVSDLVNIGDSGRMRAWVLAMAVALLAVMVMESMGLFALDAATTRPGYRTSNFMWPRYLLGGLLFGVGMTLASGCGNKTLVRIGAGNIKSIFVFVVMGAMAFVMNRTNFNYDVFLSWMTPLYIDFSTWGIPSQDLGGLATAIPGVGIENYAIINQAIGIVLAVLLIIIAFRSRDFRSSGEKIFGGVVVGLAVAAAWYVTAGPIGQTWMTEFEMADIQPEAVRAQSFTFVDPSGQSLYYLSQGADASLLTFGLMAALGVFAGSLIWAIMSNTFRIEWFVNFGDFFKHIIGGALMGIGGILSFGCTIGQAVTGTSTLALGSFLTFGAIVLGSALTMKIQLYKMVYEDASIFAVLLTSLVEVRLLPKFMRKLDAV